ncbi:uncharacterized protein [Lolium perenne]|uniref:uncharacterized protein n=1 Tax=Lolium perenne TaxID=4522 RepID=UPI003A99770C
MKRKNIQPTAHAHLKAGSPRRPRRSHSLHVLAFARTGANSTEVKKNRTHPLLPTSAPTPATGPRLHDRRPTPAVLLLPHPVPHPCNTLVPPPGSSSPPSHIPFDRRLHINDDLRTVTRDWEVLELFRGGSGGVGSPSLPPLACPSSQPSPRTYSSRSPSSSAYISSRTWIGVELSRRFQGQALITPEGREEQAAYQVRNQRAGRRKHKSVNYVLRMWSRFAFLRGISHEEFYSDYCVANHYHLRQPKLTRCIAWCIMFGIECADTL